MHSKLSNNSSENSRPVLEIKKQKIDVILDFLTISVLAFCWVYVALNFTKLPDQIPLHYNFKGEVDNYGSKMTVWILPLIITIVLLLFRILSKYPHKFNYLVTITNDNAEKQYRLATRMMSILGFNISCLFSYIVVKINTGAHENHSTLEWWFIPLLLIAVIAPTFYMIFASASKK